MKQQKRLHESALSERIVLNRCHPLRFLTVSLLSLLLLLTQTPSSNAAPSAETNKNVQIKHRKLSSQKECLDLHTTQTDRFITCLYNININNNPRRRNRNRIRKNNAITKCTNNFRNGLNRISSNSNGDGTCEKRIKDGIVKNMVVDLCKKDGLKKQECAQVVEYYVGIKMFGLEYNDMITMMMVVGDAENADRVANVEEEEGADNSVSSQPDSYLMDEQQQRPFDENNNNQIILQPADNVQIVYQPVEPSDPSTTPVINPLPIQPQPPQCEENSYITKCIDATFACCQVPSCPPCEEEEEGIYTPPPPPIIRPPIIPPLETPSKWDRIFDSSYIFLNTYPDSAEYGHSISLSSNSNNSRMTITPRYHAVQTGSTERDDVLKMTHPITVILDTDGEEEEEEEVAPIYATKEAKLPMGKDDVGNRALFSRVDDGIMLVRYNTGVDGVDGVDDNNKMMNGGNVGVVQVYSYLEEEGVWELVGGILNNDTAVVESIGGVALADKVPMFITEVLCFSENEDYYNGDHEDYETNEPEYPEGYPNPEYPDGYYNPEYPEGYPNPEYPDRYPNPDHPGGYYNPGSDVNYPGDGEPYDPHNSGGIIDGEPDEPLYPYDPDYVDPYAPLDGNYNGPYYDPNYDPNYDPTDGNGYDGPYYDPGGQQYPGVDFDPNRPPDNRPPGAPNDPYVPGVNGPYEVPIPDGSNPDYSEYGPYDPEPYDPINSGGGGADGSYTPRGNDPTNGGYNGQYIPGGNTRPYGPQTGYDDGENGFDGYYGGYEPPKSNQQNRRNLQYDIGRRSIITRKFRVHSISRNGTIEQIGDDIQKTIGMNYSAFDSGTSVGMSIDGRTIAVGFRTFGDKCNSVAVYQLSTDQAWIQAGRTMQLEDEFCTGQHTLELHLYGQYIAVGSVQREGLVRVYHFDGRDWIQKGNDLRGDGRMNSAFGKSLSMNEKGDRIAVGAPNHNGPDGERRLAGQVQIFQYDFDRNVWRTDSVIYGEDKGQRFGFSVSMDLDGSRVAVGSIGDGGRAEVYQVASS